MASIVLLLSELLGGESATALAASRYMRGGQGFREFRAAVTDALPGQDGRSDSRDRATAAAAGAARQEERTREESFEDLAVSRIAVDVMWP